MKFDRFIVCGDSFSEGMSDEITNGYYRGWADRMADVLAQENPGFRYVNLAVRGKLVEQVTEDQIPKALTFVTGKQTLLSFHAGANDTLRPKYDAAVTIKKYQNAVREIAKSGATIMLFTVLEDTGNTGKAAEIWKIRFSEFNSAVRDIAAEVGAILNDANGFEFFKDNRFLAFDRLHLNQDGHYRTAQAILEKIGYPFDPAWSNPLPPPVKSSWLQRQQINAKWFLTFALPWIWRRLRGKSSGDGRVAKYPEPISWPIKN